MAQSNYTLKLTLDQAAYVRKLVEQDHARMAEAVVRGEKPDKETERDWTANQQLRIAL